MYTDLGGRGTPTEEAQNSKATHTGLGMDSVLYLLGFTVNLVPAPNRGALLLLPQ